MEPFRPSDVNKDKIDRSKRPTPPPPKKAPELPPEIQLMIAGFADLETQKNLRLLSRDWARIIDDPGVYSIKKFHELYPELYQRIEQLIPKINLKPKKKGLLGRIKNLAVKKPEPLPKLQKGTLPYRTVFAALFLQELKRLCQDYEVPLYGGSDAQKIDLSIVGGLKEDIKQKQDLSLCQFCRILYTDHAGSLIEEIEGAKIQLAEDLFDPKAYLKEAESWRKFLQKKPPKNRQLEIDNIFGHLPQLAHIPPEICFFSNLKRMIIKYIQLKSLPPEIGQLKHLETLILTFSTIKSLPPEIGDLQELITLKIYNLENSPIMLSHQILNCKQLKNLLLSPVSKDECTGDVLKKLKKQKVKIIKLH